MTDLVAVRKGGPAKISLAEIQSRLDARKQVAEARSTVSTKVSRIEQAKAGFEDDPLETLVKVQEGARVLADVFDATITLDTIPLSQAQINKLSEEFLQLERLKIELAALEGRYRSLVFAHLDETGPKIPGRPAAQVPGKVEAKGDGSRYVFERRGGNRSNPDLNTESLREVLPQELAAQLYKTVQHPAVPAWEEKVFDMDCFGKLVDDGKIDLDVVADHLTPGKWNTPSFYKTLVDGDK